MLFASYIYGIITDIWLLVQRGIQGATFLFVPSLSADPFNGLGVDLNGWALLNYYTSLLGNYFAEYPWPIRICYFIVTACIVVMVLLYTMFLKDYILRRRKTGRYGKVQRKFHDAFLEILSNDSLTITEMEQILGCSRDDLKKYNPDQMARLIAAVRMEIYEVVYLPNLQTLTEITGVLPYFETCLLREHNVFAILQMLLMFQIVVTEGRLAGYVNSHNDDIRMMARMLYIICSQNEPYYYLVQDLDAPQSMMRPMLMHYIFGWMKEQGKLMPDFLAIASRLGNEDMAAFMIREVAYWGNADEKKRIPEFYLSPNNKCRSAAISVTAHLADEEAEDKLVESFPKQPQEIKHEILQAMLTIRSGKHVEFLEKVFRESPSHTTRELALTCLYNHGKEGRRAFEHIKNNVPEEEKILMEQIDSNSILLQIQLLK